MTTFFGFSPRCAALSATSAANSTATLAIIIAVCTVRGQHR